ncbi:uncharacterized protein LOC113437196 [Pseudonaja textilis]|uniref:uncharacterized protein LOC113437196 n=1 Tax=Pseudonaja textilis TaxID=8673 RepID=UPI000EA89801|nr:uncharacterized protein LOC113437196 [Pseudonaja textilis]
MATFQNLLYAFLLLNVLSYIQAGDNCLSCSEPNIAELGKGIMIKCKSKIPILLIGLKFCPFKGDNCSAKVIIKEHGSWTENETTLKLYSNCTAFLSIYPIKISHEGNYILNYITENGISNLTIRLEVFAPYTRPQIMKQEDILICTASEGYPEEKLYWVSKTGTNLIHKATSQSVKTEDGSFSLSNTLQLESAPSETEYCCIFNQTRVPNRQTVSECMTFENATTSTIITEETTLNMTGAIVIVIIVISLASILLAVMWWRKKRKNGLLQDKTVSQELMVLIAEEGQSVNLNCKFMHVIEGLYLKRTFGDVTNVLYVTQHGKIKKEDSAYENRTEYFEMNNTVTITLKHLKEKDSDVYMCTAGMVINNELVQKNSSPILLAIKEAAEKKFEFPWMLFSIISLLILLLFMLGFYIIDHTNIKKCFQKRHAKTKQNFIYEDMTYSLRHKKSEPKINQYAI